METYASRKEGVVAMTKPHPVFDSLWYNVVFTIIAAVMLAVQVSEIVSRGFSDGPTGSLVIWIIISFHFVQKAYFCSRDKDL